MTDFQKLQELFVPNWEGLIQLAEQVVFDPKDMMAKVCFSSHMLAMDPAKCPEGLKIRLAHVMVLAGCTIHTKRWTMQLVNFMDILVGRKVLELLLTNLTHEVIELQPQPLGDSSRTTVEFRVHHRDFGRVSSATQVRR